MQDEIPAFHHALEVAAGIAVVENHGKVARPEETETRGRGGGRRRRRGEKDRQAGR